MTSAASTSRMAATGKETTLWLLERLSPGTGVNNIGMAPQVNGRLRPEALATSIAIVVGRHDALRTVYRVTGGELTKEVVTDGEISVDIERLSLPGDQISKGLAEFIGRPFALNGREHRTSELDRAHRWLARGESPRAEPSPASRAVP